MGDHSVRVAGETGDSYQLSVISYQLSIISYQLSVISYQFTVYYSQQKTPQFPIHNS
ncbi:MAG: hypothetical protein IM526_26380 [Microcystis sp. M38BS1]|uniref:hypothetical protein n=1 Tax=Microcystis sp. M38BS1 TaxID=2771188 RepID=UPI0031FC38CC|nr:hypothetical protein [Microcystis sp. M38BS1]